MDKLAIKKFAIWARTELLNRIRTLAEHYGVTEQTTEIEIDVNVDAVGHPLSDTEIRQRRALLTCIQRIGYEQTIEEVAFTWFNRFCALRFMEVNGFLPQRTRLFSDENNAFQPQILNEAAELEMRFDNIDMVHIYDLIENNQTEELYKYLILLQCEALEPLLPSVFSKIEDYAKLLFPAPILRAGSIIDKMISMIPIDEWKDSVQITGWLYQYYITEKHEAVIDPLHGKSIQKDDIPAATQLFTPDWVVRYITDNTIGRYWLEHHPQSTLATHLKYYVSNHAKPCFCDKITPNALTVFDPCVGSGHFLVYAIDVLMMIYREYGYSDREAIASIIQNNIYGLDIDRRAVQLACFSVMMKGCQYDRRFLRRGIQPQIYQITDSHTLENTFINDFCGSNLHMKTQIDQIIALMDNAQEYGSMIQCPALDLNSVEKRLSDFSAQTQHQLQCFTLNTIVNTLRLLSLKYTVVITNPPYLNKYAPSLKSYIQKNYKDYSGDLFSIFIYRCTLFCTPLGYTGLMTPNVWMFIKSYEKLRRNILQKHSITTLVQMAKGAFYSEATVDVCAFVIQTNCINETGVYFRLEEFSGNMDLQNQKLSEAINDPSCAYVYRVPSTHFKNLPGYPIGYWTSTHILDAFQNGRALNTLASPRQGMATTDNHKYLRHWFEVNLTHIGFDLDKQTAIHSGFKWFPYNKGGTYRKWYGNQDYIVNYQNDGQSIKHDVLTKYPYLKTPDYVVKNQDTYFKPSLSWSKISSGSVAFRYFPRGFLYDVSGCSIFFKNDLELYIYAGFLNSVVCKKILEIISPTLNYETGHIAILPILETQAHEERIKNLVQDNIQISMNDWDSYETSWHFKKHPLI